MVVSAGGRKTQAQNGVETRGGNFNHAATTYSRLRRRFTREQATKAEIGQLAKEDVTLFDISARRRHYQAGHDSSVAVGHGIQDRVPGMPPSFADSPPELKDGETIDRHGEQPQRTVRGSLEPLACYAAQPDSDVGVIRCGSAGTPYT